MKPSSERERRRYPRFPQTLDVQASDVPPLKYKGQGKPPLTGRAQNVSKGGFCLLTDQPVDRSSLMLCHVGVSEGTTAIPTLVQVRWTRKQEIQDESYLSGVQFLF
ncbi:MAG: PilZ domain-containing protein [Terriglobales bacterium]